MSTSRPGVPLLSMTACARIAAGFIAMVAAGIAVAAAPAGEPDELDTVLVTGARTAPVLWKVSKDNHVLWILAAYGSLPADANWREVEARIAGSREVLSPGDGNAYIDISLISIFKLGMAIPKARAGETQYQYKEPDEKHLPDQKTLKDVLPADTWERWLELRRKYIGENDEVDRYRPAAAVLELENAAYGAVYRAAFPGSDLRRVGIWDAVELAKKHKARIHRLPDVERKVKVANPRDLVTSAGNQALPDLECFTESLDSLEYRLEWRRSELDAWLRGDLARLRTLHVELPWRWRGSCFDMRDALIFALGVGELLQEPLDTTKVRQLADEVRRNREQADLESQEDWIAAARAAIRRNKSTFTVASLNEIIGPSGFIEKLRPLGYTVEGPM